MQIDHNYRIRTFGHFDLFKGDKSLFSQTTNAKKIWDLIKFLYTYRDKSFTPESLVDQLWPAEDYTDPRGTLRRQMHRMRQILEEDGATDQSLVLFSNGSYRWNPAYQAISDSEHFETLVKQGESLISSPCVGDKAVQTNILALDQFEKAIALYSGDYIPDCIDQHWVFSVRHHYRRLYLKAVTFALNIQQSLGYVEAMINTASSALKIDVYEEHFHLMYMEALLQQGNTKQALEHYEYITRFFYNEMGVAPSVGFKQLYKKLLSAPASKGLGNGSGNGSGSGSASGSLLSDYGIDLSANSSEEILAVLDDHGPIENAFFCGPEVFKSIYELERRRSQRSGNSFSVAVLNLQKQPEDTLAQDHMRNEHFRAHLGETLRLGDTYASWGERQYVVLLPGVDEDLMQKVMTRVLSRYIDKALVTIERVNHLPALVPTANYDYVQGERHEA